ncbi:hypothetical protein QWJ41_21625, partial [Nocardioides sp. SOB44]
LFFAVGAPSAAFTSSVIALLLFLDTHAARTAFDRFDRFGPQRGAEPPNRFGRPVRYRFAEPLPNRRTASLTTT